MEKDADSDGRQILNKIDKDKSNTYHKSSIHRLSRSIHPDVAIKTETCSGYDYADDRCFFFIRLTCTSIT